MKNKVIMLLTLLFINKHCLNAQNGKSNKDQNVIEYDYNTGRFSGDFHRFVKENSTIYIEYTNINPFAFRLNDSFQYIDYSYTDGMSVIAQIFNAPTQGASAANAAIATPIADSSVTEKAVKKGEQTLNDKNLKDAATEWENTNNELGLLNPTVASVFQIMRLNKYIEDAMADVSLNSKDKMMACIQKHIGDDNIKQALKDKELANLFNNKITAINESVARLKMHVKTLTTINTALLKSNPNYAFTNDLQELSDAVDSLFVNYNYSSANCQKLYDNLAIIISNLDKIENTPFAKRIDEIAVAQPDLIVLNTGLKDNTGKDVLKIAPLTFRTYGGLRINTSIGVAATFGAVNGSEYDFKKNPAGSLNSDDTGKVTLIESRKNKGGAFSPVVFVHVYPTLPSFVYWRTVSVGFGPDFTDLNKSKLFIGTGIAFCRSNSNIVENVISRIGFDCGLSLGFADVLKEKYKGYSDYAAFQDIAPADLVTRVLKPGFFASVSVNLTPLKTVTKSN